MKKFVLPIVAVIGCWIGITACDNGVYDMTPNVDKSHMKNPLVHPAGHNGTLYMGADVKTTYVLNGWTNLYNGWYDIRDTVSKIYGWSQTGDSTTIKTMSLNFYNFHGVGVYYLNTDVTATWVDDLDHYASSYGQVIVDTASGGIIYGRFSFTGTNITVANGIFKVFVFD
jgi:hypothetical protein